MSPDKFQFEVQFEKPDGSLYVQGSCCGSSEEEMPLESEFEFVVRKIGVKYLVMTPPVYVP